MVLAVGTRLQDFTTGSWTLFADDARFIGINAARFDAQQAHEPAGGRRRQGGAGGDLRRRSAASAAPAGWAEQGSRLYAEWNAYIDRRSGPTNAELPTYAHVVGAVNRLAGERDLALTAAGGMPGELLMNWKAKGVATFDCEFGFSCMGYEIAGGWGAKMADPSRDVFVMVGDGSYLMMNSDIYSSVLTGHEADRRRLRQWRLPGHRPAAAGQGHSQLQQQPGDLPHGRAGRSGSTSPSMPNRWGRSASASAAIGELEDAIRSAPRPPTARR